LSFLIHSVKHGIGELNDEAALEEILYEGFITNNKFQTNHNKQISDLVIVIWCLFGICYLFFVISPYAHSRH